MSATLFVQIVALLFQIGAFTIFFRQLLASERTLRLTTLIQRRELYVSLTHSLSEDNIRTMMLHAFDHFEMDIYNRDYAGNLRRIRSYLLMKRKYFYLVVASGIKSDEIDPLHNSPNKWLEELCQYKEFHDVHEKHRHYYPKFSCVVDPLIAKTPSPIWAPVEDTYPSPSQQSVPADVSASAALQ